jgi:hypothetical protein
VADSLDEAKAAFRAAWERRPGSTARQSREPVVAIRHGTVRCELKSFILKRRNAIRL